MFVSVSRVGSPPYVLFRQALDAGDLARVRALAATMPRVSLADALRICELMRDHDTYERAAVRWIGRLALEGKDVALEDLQAAAAALAALPLRPDSAVASLTAICARCGAS